MQFRIADTFTDSLARLTGDEQKVVKTTAFDLQLNPANPGMQFHKLTAARDANFWSIRVSRDIRLIVHSSADSLLLCYVDHHDKAYQWAERRKLETHPKTGAAQLVEIRETVQAISVPIYIVADCLMTAKPALFQNMPEELLGFGMPVFSPETSGNAYFRLRSHGSPWVSMSGAALKRCGLTIGHRTRFECGLTACWERRSRMSMGMWRIGGGPCRYSTDQSRIFASSKASNGRKRQWVRGSRRE